MQSGLGEPTSQGGLAEPTSQFAVSVSREHPGTLDGSSLRVNKSPRGVQVAFLLQSECETITFEIESHISRGKGKVGLGLLGRREHFLQNPRALFTF